MAKKLLNRLNYLKSDFTQESTIEKIEILRALADIEDTKQIIRFHDDLCFMQAYPDNKKVLTEVNRALARFSDIIDNEYENTGIVGTTVSYAFSFQTAEWLYKKYPDDITISWEDFEQQDVLLEFLQALTSPFEAAALDDVNLGLEAWVKFVASKKNKTDFEWVLHKIVHSGMPKRDLEAIYGLMDIPINWKLRRKTASRTMARIPATKTVYQTGTLSRKKIDIKKHVCSPVGPPELVNEGRGRKLIEKSITVLGVRCREIYPLFFPNPKDVWIINLDRAITFIFIGMRPLRRLSLESEYFFLGLKNNIPVTYGSGTVCFDQVEVAANIFSSFRQGESTFIYAQLMRAFYQIFGTNSFLVQKFQIGAEENTDALKSGAFWFYHKLGFHPIDKKITKFAEEENRKRQRTKGYRSSIQALEKLATSDMRFSVKGSTTIADKLSLPGLALLMSEYLSENTNTLKQVNEVCKTLHINDLSGWTQPERYWFEQFCPLVLHIPDISNWTKSDREELAILIKAKGSPSEFEYIRRWNKHKGFQKALFALSKKGQKILKKLVD